MQIENHKNNFGFLRLLLATIGNSVTLPGDFRS